MKSRLIALLLSLTLCISLSVPALAMCKDERSSSYTDGLISFDSDVEIEEALVRVAQEKINRIAADVGETPPVITKVRYISDFAENDYTLFECEPSGYLIYNNAAGTFVESSAISQSPYIECEGDLYYAGVLNYYYQDADKDYVHTETGYTIDASAEVRAACKQMQQELLSASRPVKNSGFETMNSLTASSGTRFVSNYGYIRNLQTEAEMGYAEDGDDGMCGWIASGIAILYLQCNSGARVIPSNYVSSNYKFKGDGFTWLLRGYGVNSDTFGSDLASAIIGYATDRSFPLTATHTFVTSADHFITYIDKDLPVVAGGALWDCRSSSSYANIA